MIGHLNKKKTSRDTTSYIYMNRLLTRFYCLYKLFISLSS